MKIRDNSIFPHPVLRESSDDYIDGNFDMEFEVDEVKCEIKTTVIINESAILGLINSGLAKVGFFIICQSTSYTELKLINIDKDVSVLNFDRETVRGVVRLRPVIFSSGKIENYSSHNFNSEFNGAAFTFPPGILLAFAPEREFSAGSVKLQPTETIFSLANNNDLKDGEVNVGLENEKIEIIVNTSTQESINKMRVNNIGRRALIAGLYQSVVMEVLHQVSVEPGRFEGKHWFKVFKEKCVHLGINIDNPNLFEDSQRVLRLPLLQLTSCKELTI
ncbi:TPA: hypothetical protein ACKP2J_004926 [Serratia marcescens]